MKLWKCVSFSNQNAWVAPLVLTNKVPFLFLLQESASPPQVKSMTFLITNGETFSNVSLSVLVIARNFGSNIIVFVDRGGKFKSGGRCMVVVPVMLPAAQTLCNSCDVIFAFGILLIFFEHWFVFTNHGTVLYF